MRLTLLLAMSVLAGCASFGKMASDPTEIVFATDAETNMKLANEAYDDKNFPEAARYFEYVKNKYPYLEAAREAELKLADCDYAREQWVTARDRYKNFERLHPSHPQVDYAAFRAAESHYKDIPSDFFILPPSSEKDQVEVRSSLTALSEFIRLYPNSRFVADAKKVMADVKHRLAEHEVYVAEFYAKREKWNAVVGRYSVVTKNYGGVGYDEQAALGIYEAQMALNEPEKAKDALRAFLRAYPQDPAAPKARRLLGTDVAAVEAPVKAVEAVDAGQ